MCYKNPTVVNDTSSVIRMITEHGASFSIDILMTLKVLFMPLKSSVMLLENIHNTGDALMIVIFLLHRPQRILISAIINWLYMFICYMPL